VQDIAINRIFSWLRYRLEVRAINLPASMRGQQVIAMMF